MAMSNRYKNLNYEISAESFDLCTIENSKRIKINED